MTAGRLLPEEQRKQMRRARWLELIWIVVLGTIVVAIYLALGNSQAMKTAWIEDLLSFVPPLAFLLCSWIEEWAPNDRFPLGFIRINTLGYLVSAVAVAGVGAFLIVDSALVLIHAEQPTIGSVEIFGVTLWLGWLMIVALVYSVIWPMIFGRLKMRPARQLHDKILWADALMNKADWLTGLAAIVGVIGIGFGLWWADAVAAIFIAVDVVHDGYRHTGAAIRDLTSEMPRSVDDKEFEPLVSRVKKRADRIGWVSESRLRVREEGRFLVGTVFVLPNVERVDPGWIREAERDLLSLHWRLHDLSVVLVPDFDGVKSGRTEPEEND